MLSFTPLLPRRGAHSGRLALCAWLVCGALALSGCSSKNVGMDEDSPIGQVKDLRVYPQNVQPYAEAIGADTLLLDATTQAVQDARYNERFFSPWEKTKSSFSPRAFKRLIGKSWGYTGVQAWSPDAWDAVVANINAKKFPSLAAPAITVRDTNLREAPTFTPRYSRSTPNPAIDPFDNMQYSLLPVGMPLFVTHASRDGQWYFVENALVSGWVLAADTALVNDTFMQRYRNGNYAAILKDNVSLTTDDGDSRAQAHIGTILPISADLGTSLRLFIPQRDAQGYAVTRQVTLDASAAARKPLPLRAGTLATLGNIMISQPYGWGGTNGDRDCSSTTRDLFAPFGLWLPRNSAAQAHAGQLIMVDTLPNDSKEQLLLDMGKPFISLVWFKGHVGLYLGKYKRHAAMLHNIWGVRVTHGGNGLERHIIGRCVISGINPGQELSNADKEQPLSSRMQGISILPKE